MKKFCWLSVFLLTALLTAMLPPITAQPPKKEQKKDGKKEILGTIERRDPRFDKLVPKDAQLEKIGDGFAFTEGAVWYKPGNCLLFSDIPNNVVVKWQEGKGTSEFLKPSGFSGGKAPGGKGGGMSGSNGLAVDSHGRLLLCEHGDRRVTRIEKDGKKTVLADKFDGKRLNSPNDLVLHPNGDIYFTDPDYGLQKGDKRELNFTGVFRISAKDGKVSLVAQDLAKPNGIALTPDAKLLYVTNGQTWVVFPVNEDGTTGAHKVFVDTRKWTGVKGGAILDGMKVDAQGNLFATGPGGLCVMAPDGTLLGIFRTGEQSTANCCFGEADGQTLFICCNRKIGRVRVTTKGIGW